MALISSTFISDLSINLKIEIMKKLIVMALVGAAFSLVARYFKFTSFKEVKNLVPEKKNLVPKLKQMKVVN